MKMEKEIYLERPSTWEGRPRRVRYPLSESKSVMLIWRKNHFKRWGWGGIAELEGEKQGIHKTYFRSTDPPPGQSLIVHFGKKYS